MGLGSLLIQRFRRKELRLIDTLILQDQITSVSEKLMPSGNNRAGGSAYGILSKAHRRQIADILTFTRASEKSAAEQSADRSLALGISSLSLTTVGRLIYAPLGGVGVLITLYLIAQIFQYVVRTLWKQRQLTADILDVLLAIGIISNGYFSIAALGVALNAITRKLMAQTDASAWFSAQYLTITKTNIKTKG